MPVYADTSGCCVAIATQRARRNFIHRNFVHLVGLYTYCKMMHGAYNVKLSGNYLFSNTNVVFFNFRVGHANVFPFFDK